MNANAGAHAQTTPAQVYAQNQELITALRNAYPNQEDMPEEDKELIERTEKELSKSITTNIHASTRALSRAQKALGEATEARRKHRSAWMQYLKEGLEAWEKSLDSYRRQQAALQAAATKARQDITMARQAIENNAKAAVDPSVLKHASTAIKDEPEEQAQEDAVDQEEEKLRASLQGVLKACAGSLGLNVEGDNQPSDPPLEITDSDDDERTAKRPRSKDALASSVHS